MKHRIRFFRWRPRRFKLRGTSFLFKRFSSFEGLELRTVLSGGSLLNDAGIYSSALGDDSDSHASPVNLMSISCLLASNQGKSAGDSGNSGAVQDEPPPVAPLAAAVDEAIEDETSDPIAQPLVEGILGEVTVVMRDLQGNRIFQVADDQEFILELYVADTRAEDVIHGFFSAYAGVTFDATKFEVADPSSLQVEDRFTDFHVRTNIAAGKVRAGGTSFDSSPDFDRDEPQLLWSVRMRAIDATDAPVAFTPTFEDFDDIGAKEEWLVYDLEDNDVLTADNFEFKPTLFTVDGPPVIWIDDASLAETDANQVMNFTVRISKPATSGSVTVSYSTAPGSATAGDDYTATSGTLTFSGNTTEQVIQVTVVGDLLVEAAEDFSVVLSNPTNATLIESVANGTITNDDESTITIGAISQDEGDENNSMLFTVSLTKPSSTPITVEFATADITGGNGATAGSDYTATSGTLTFAAGVTSRTITVTINGDTTVEENETFQLLLSDPVGAELEGTGTVTGTIVNDDGPRVSISPVTTTLAEGDTNSTATFVISVTDFDEDDVVVTYATVAGSATAGNDYIATSGTLTFTAEDHEPKTVMVTIVGDEIGEVDETFSVQLSNPQGGTIAQGTASITLDNDDEPAITITGPANKNENANGGKYVLTATLSEESEERVTVVWNTANDSAQAGSDYTATGGTLTFEPGTTTALFTVQVTGDTTIENDEQFKIVLSNPDNASLPQTEFLADILNDDLPTVSISTTSGTEGDSGTTNFVFTVALSQAINSQVTVVFNTANGIATSADNDYVPTSGTLTFEPNQLSTTVTVQVVGDTRPENANETFRVDLSAPVGAILSTTNASATATIVDDDGPPVISIGNVSKAEGDSGTTPFLFTVTLSDAASGTVTVAYATSNGSAQAGSDYTATSGTLTFAAGTTSQVITVNVTGDLVDEQNETFTVTLSNPSGATIDDGSGVGTIEDEAGDNVQNLPSMVSGRVFVDRNGSGTQDIYEASIAGATVTLSGAASQTTTSSETGAYSFGNLNPGTYTVTFTLPVQYRDGDPVLGSLNGTENENGYTFTIPAGGGVAATGYHFVSPGTKLAFTSIRQIQASTLAGLTNPPGEVVAVAISTVTNPVNASNAASTSISGTGTPGTSISVVVTDGTNTTAPFTTTVNSNGSWTINNINVVTLGDGTLTYTATASNGSGETASASITTTKGTVNPTVTVSSVTNPINDNNEGDTSISGTGTPGGTVTVTATDGTNTTDPQTTQVNGNGTWSLGGIDVSDLNDGTITYNVTISINGQTATTTRTSTKDTVAPTVTINELPPITSENEEDYSISGTGQAGDTISVVVTGPGGEQIELDDVEVGANNTWTITGINLSTLEDGTITFNVTSTDDAGNTGQANRSVTKDTEETLLLIVDVTDPINNQNETETEISGTGAEGATISVVASDGTNSTDPKTTTVGEDEIWTVSDIDVSELADGTITYTVTMTKNGVTSTDTVEAVKNTVAPELTVEEVTDPIGIADLEDVSASGTGDAGNTIRVVVTDGTNQSTAVEVEVDSEGNWTADGIDVSNLADGELTFIITATDSFGNVTTNSSQTATKTTVAVDAITETITQANEEDFEVSGTGQQGATVSVVATSGTATTDPVEVEIGEGGTWTVSIDVSELNDGTITFTVTASEGGASVVRTVTATKDATATAVIEEVTNPISSANETETEISGTGEEGALLSVVASNGAQETEPVTGEIDEVGNWALTVDVSGLADGTITYTVTVTDGLGNVTEYTIQAQKDTEGPTLSLESFPDSVGLSNRSDLTLSGTSTGAQTITVIVTDGTTDSAEYTATIGAGGDWTVSGIDVSTLKDGTITYKVTAVDATGNETLVEETAEKSTLLINAITATITQLNETTFALSGTGQAEAALSIVASDGTNPLPAVLGEIGENGEWTVTIDVSTLGDGTITFTVTASEGEDSIIDSVTATKDSVAEALIDEVTDPITSANEENTTISGTGEADATLSIVASNGDQHTEPVAGSIDELGNWSVSGIDVSGLDDGTITYTVTVTDGLGNVTEYTIEAEKDATGPDLAVTSQPEAIDFTNRGGVTIAGTSDNGAKVTIVARDGTGETEPQEVIVGEEGTWTFPVDVTELADGPIKFTITSEDELGNETVEEVTIDKKTLTILDVTDPINSDNETEVVIHGLAQPGVTVAVSTGEGGPTDEMVVGPDGLWSFTLDVSGLADGPITFTVSTTLEIEETEETFTETMIVQKDTEIEVVADEVTSPITSANETATSVSGTGDANSELSIVAGDGANDTEPVTGEVDAEGNWMVSGIDVSGLDDGPITYTVTITDAAGNTTQTTIVAQKDTNVELVLDEPLPITIENLTSYEISGTGEVGATVTVRATDGALFTEPQDVTIGESGEFTLTLDLSTLAEGNITFEIVAFDELENELEVERVLQKSTLSVDEPAAINGDNQAAYELGGKGQINAIVSAIASDGVNEDVTSAEVTIDGDGNWIITMDLSTLDDGPITITVTAAAGGESVEIEIIVQKDTEAEPLVGEGDDDFLD